MTQEHYLEYLRNIYLKKDGNPLSESSVQHYLEAMRYINEYFRIRKGDEFSIYEISDITELKIFGTNFSMNLAS